MDSTNVEIIKFIFNGQDYTLTILLNLWVLIAAFIVTYGIYWVLKKYSKKGLVHKEIVPVKLKYKNSGAEIEYSITRNYQNIEIAYRIYIELITRKAAIEIEEDKDVIVEVYNSWYSLFKITRDELKKMSGMLLIKNEVSEELIRLLTDILNKGLRPHLTEYQARFRKWYNEEISKEGNISLSPQEIQKRFNDYNNLLQSMQEVNKLLIEYAEQLRKFINGEN